MSSATKSLKAVAMISSLILLGACQKTSFTRSLASIDSSSVGVLSLSDFEITGKLNTPLEFTYPTHLQVQQMTFSYSSIAVKTVLRTANGGLLELLDSSNLKMRYTPKFGFRGQETQTIFLTDFYGTRVSANLTIIIGNHMNLLQPALAIRASACIACHTSISSNYITDFGFGGDGKGKDYYFGNNSPLAWNSGSIYGDHGTNLHPKSGEAINQGSFSTFNFLDSLLKVFVPKAPTPDDQKNMSGKSTLASYLQDRLVNSETATTQKVSIIEKGRVFIGAPTAQKILSAFQMSESTAPLKFIGENSQSQALSGFSFAQGIVRNSGVVVCEGDLAVRGMLYLENLQIVSKTGCHIYVTESVFIYGGIQYLNKTENTNLQITSARAIVMGAGSVFKDGKICESSDGWYAKIYSDPNYATLKENYNSSLLHRFKTLWTLSSHFLRENKDPKDLAADVYNDAMKVQASVGTLYDASCRPETRDISYERLLLNAPQVHSRYKGNFKGMIITEFALMSLGQFVFAYDPVFTKNTNLPMLDESDFLAVEE